MEDKNKKLKEKIKSNNLTNTNINKAELLKSIQQKQANKTILK